MRSIISFLKLDTDLKKRRLVGIGFAAVLLVLFLLFNRIPKLDTVAADLAIATSPMAECFQGFCLEDPDKKNLWERWWNFSLTYLNLVWIGMTFAFVMAGITEAFLFPADIRERFEGRGVKGVFKGLIIGPVMNLCSACIVPIATAFRRRGASVETTVAITQGSSTMNLPALIMVVLVFIPFIGGSRIALSILGAILIGPIVAKVAGRGDEEEFVDGNDTNGIANDLPDGITWRESLTTASLQFVRSTFKQTLRLGPIMVVAGFMSGFAIQWVSPDTVTAWLGDDVVGIVIAASLGLAINVPLMFEIPLVAAMLLAGMGTAPAGSLLFTAAAGGPITFWGLAKVMPRKGVLTLGMSTWVLGVVGGIVLLAVTAILEEERVFSFKADYDEGRAASNFRHTRTEKIDSPTFDGNGGQNSTSTAAANSNIEGLEIGPFTNVALDALVNVKPWADQVLNYRPGVVIFDFDRDGHLDFFITAESGSPNMLYRNNGSGKYVDIAARAGVDAVTANSSGAVACDINNDGFQDLYVGSRGLGNMGPSKSKADHLDFRSALVDSKKGEALRDAIGDRLFLNKKDGTFQDISSQAFGEDINYRSAGSIACADVNNDGWLDFYVGNLIDEDFFFFDRASHPGHYNSLFINKGNLLFKDMAEEAGVAGLPIKLLSPDGVPIEFTDDQGNSYVGYDPNELDENGNVIGDPTGRTHAVLFFDYDDDGDQDLWVGNDGDILHLYENISTKETVEFVAVSEDMGIDIAGNWMGFAVGDYDHDEDLDVFVTNQGFHLLMHPPQEEPGGDCRYFERFDWGTCLNLLLRNEGTNLEGPDKNLGRFIDVTSNLKVKPSPLMPPASLDPSTIHPEFEKPQGLAAYDFGYGATFFDADNDGYLDLYWLGAEVGRGEGPGGTVIQSAGRMLRGLPEGGFEDVTVTSHLLDIMDVNYDGLTLDASESDLKARRIGPEFHENGKALAHGDLNNDGYVDLIGTNSSGPVWDVPGKTVIPSEGTIFVWINKEKPNSWITIILKGRMAIDGTGSNADGIGARVYVKTTTENGDSKVYVQEVRAGSSYISMDSLDLEFGLGKTPIVDEIEILWPSGTKQTLQQVATNQKLEVIEPK